MREAEEIFKAITSLNMKYGHTLVIKEDIEEERSNIEELPDINKRLAKCLCRLENIDGKKELALELLELHGVLVDIEWQYDQLHDIVRQAVSNLTEELEE
ncbi:hypothetical protein [Listeria newyorkensis]|uniref:Uncharacterized protein n=1 Tax=Listeria newyorkensis TaxID=1497681 RepID=A0A841YYA0_9LIST|nr:hypothetical protein [Listeria newyorkensis]MBC1458288.1 hypothetical protein [Listeria newyorkensis]